MQELVAYRGKVVIGVAVTLYLLFSLSVSRLQERPRKDFSREIEVLLPVGIQVLMTAGDRYLAANLAAIRGYVVATEKMRPEEYEVLAKVQLDASWLNPAHEENYYSAAAILPWSGKLDAAQLILKRATHARPFDYQPAFLYAFNRYHFLGDAEGAAIWMRDAAIKLPDDENRLVMQNIAARWIEKASSPAVAIEVVKAMAKQAGRQDFRKYLEMRVERLQMLQKLRDASDRFRLDKGRPIGNLNELVSSGILRSLPEDPLKIGFSIDSTGQIVLKPF